MAIDRFENALDELLAEHRISDFHFHGGRPLCTRVDGQIVCHDELTFSNTEMKEILQSFMGEDDFAEFEVVMDADFALVSGPRRFRANASKSRSYKQNSSPNGSVKIPIYEA